MTARHSTLPRTGMIAVPCATIHMLTSGRTLRAWSRRSADAPFPVERDDLRNAFLLGAMAPDMGFVPGVEDRFVSELAHYVSTADLVRRLLQEAESVRQRAFAWGWATHHVTDVAVHPLVGRACGEHLHGDRSLRLNSSADVATHVAMEVGLDLVFLLEDPGIPTPPSGPVFGSDEIGFLCRALEGTYGIRRAPEKIHRDHRIAVRRTARWPQVLALLSRASEFGPERGGTGGLGGRAIDGLVRLARRFVSSGTPAAGFLAPLRPPGWVVRRVRSVAAGFAERFQERVEAGLAGLENRNLETGRPEDADFQHPDADRTLERLRKVRSGAPVPAGAGTV